MTIVAEKLLTISLTFRIRITDDTLNTKPNYVSDEREDSWREGMEQQRRLLLALLAHDEQDLTAVLLDIIAFALDNFTGTNWEQALLGKNSDDDQAFFEGGMMLSTIETMDSDDQKFWKECIKEHDEKLDSWFCLCTENLHDCFHVELAYTHIAEPFADTSTDREKI